MKKTILAGGLAALTIGSAHSWVRWHTMFDDLDREVSNLVGDKTISIGSMFGSHAGTRANIVQAADGTYTITVAAPGFNKDDMSIEIERYRGQSIVKISGKQERKKEENKAEDGSKILLREISERNFERSFSLDGEVDQSKVTATFENGQLIVTLPVKTTPKKGAFQVKIQ